MPFALAGKKIVVTGGAGFLGLPVVEALVAQGADRARIVVPRSRDLDLREALACAKAVEGADVVVHLAANAGGIGWNRSHPGALFYDNIAMGVNLLEAARRAKVAKFVQIGTVCAYPLVPPRIPFREEDLWLGYPEETNAPYGIAKKSLMVMGRAYREEYGMNVVTLLPVNLYGPRDHFFDPAKSHVIPALIAKFVDARDNGDAMVEIWGSGVIDGVPVSREFLYVDDAAEAIAMATARYDGAEPVNVGAGREVAINDLVEMVAEMAGFKGGIVRDLTKPNGQPRRCLDVSRAQDLFGFTARTTFVDGLRKTIAWYEQARKERG